MRRHLPLMLLPTAAAAILLMTAATACGQATEGYQQQDPRYGLLDPLPESGGLPAIIELRDGPTAAELAFRADVREYAKQIRAIRAKYFRHIRVADIRNQGIELLREFTDPAAFRPMIEQLDREADDVRLAVLDHFSGQGDFGQAALAWVSIYDDNLAIRNEAVNRMVTPPSPRVLQVLDGALRSPVHQYANAGGALAGSLNALETIPLLIMAQAAPQRPAGDQGDLAWIAIQTQRAYTAGLIPIAGDSSGAFQPIIGTISEGTVLRVVDAVVIVYRTNIHQSLVAMTSADWGQSTADYGYNIDRWWNWYNTEYVPHKNEQAMLQRLADQADQGQGNGGGP